VRVALVFIAGSNTTLLIMSTPEGASRLRTGVSLASAHLMRNAAALRGAPFKLYSMFRSLFRRQDDAHDFDAQVFQKS
jgi:hypothetical protein